MRQGKAALVYVRKEKRRNPETAVSLNPQGREIRETTLTSASRAVLIAIHWKAQTHK